MSERWVLSEFVDADAPTMVRADEDPEHRLRFEIPEGFVPTVAHELDVMARWRADVEAGLQWNWAVRRAEDGALVGGCQARRVGEGEVDVAYWTYPGHRGQGVAPWALVTMLDLLRDTHGVVRAFAQIAPDNHASLEVVRKCGFTPHPRDGEMPWFVRELII